MTVLKHNARILIFLLFLSFSTVTPLWAKINYSDSESKKIDLNEEKIDKQLFFQFVQDQIKARSPGLGAYGRVSFIPCDMDFEGKPLGSYENKEGREIRFLSNPSCDQMVVGTVLKQNFGYQAEKLGKYGNRKCLLSVEKVFSPLLEFYTIVYEERKKKSCPRCQKLEDNRVKRIRNYRSKASVDCGQEQKKVMHFLDELESTIESAYQEKGGRK